MKWSLFSFRMKQGSVNDPDSPWGAVTCLNPPLTLSQFAIGRYKTLTWNSEILRCRPLESLILVLKHTARFGFWFFLWSSQFFFQKRTARVYQFGNSKSRLPLR